MMVIREHTGGLPNTEFALPAEKKMTRGEKLIQQLRGKGTLKMTTDEIMALTRGED